MAKSSADVRRRPKQARSQQRVDAILAAARALIGERGNDAVSMREIAGAAKVTIGSIYQYFPSKTAILRELMHEYYGKMVSDLQAIYRDVADIDALIAANDAAVDALVDLFAREPALSSIWTGIQANPVLRTLDAEDSLRNAHFLAAVAAPLLPKATAEEILDACFFASHVLGHVVSIASTIERPSRERLIREVKRLFQMRVAALE